MVVLIDFPSSSITSVSFNKLKTFKDKFYVSLDPFLPNVYTKSDILKVLAVDSDSYLLIVNCSFTDGGCMMTVILCSMGALINFPRLY